MLLPWVLCIILAIALLVAIIKNILLKKSMVEILTDFESRKTVLLRDLIPNWWGDKRYKK